MRNNRRGGRIRTHIDNVNTMPACSWWRRGWLDEVVLASTLCASIGSCARPIQRFADQPVAWTEKDDADSPRAPRPTRLEDEPAALFIRDFFTREIDRNLSLQRSPPAADVNALDEVPCSTWFCARNHLRAMSVAAVVAGPSMGSPPVLPLTLTRSKVGGISQGFVAEDARGHKYLVKLDPAGHARLASGAEVVGQLVFHAAGYNVPGAYPLELAAEDVIVKPGAKRLLSGVTARPFTGQDVAALLDRSARGPYGKATAVAVRWLEGQTLGGFDLAGRRSDDPNDRIPHEHRRSLRASLVLFAWLNVFDASAVNTQDTYVEEGGRRFVRHYFIDFGSALGSSTTSVKSVHEGRERLLELGRITTAFLTLGLDQREWQKDTARWRRGAEQVPAVGWFDPAAQWDPDDFRTGRKIPAHLRMTTADKYWGAKLVTSFSNEQLRAIVQTAGYRPDAAAIILDTLIARRDRIADRYLTAVTGVEGPAVSADGTSLCFNDVSISRGYAAAVDTRYAFRAFDVAGRVNGQGTHQARGPRTCLPSAIPVDASEYLVVTLEASIAGRRARPARIHLAARPAERRFVVVGLERDDR